MIPNGYRMLAHPSTGRAVRLVLARRGLDVVQDELLHQVLRDQVGVDPGRLRPILDLSALGLSMRRGPPRRADPGERKGGFARYCLRIWT